MNVNNFLLGEIEMAMNDNSYEFEWYLDTRKEETTFIADPGLTGEDDTKLRELVEDDKASRFIPIPKKPSHEGWQQMKQFILDLYDQDEKTQRLLLNTIQRRGAFRRFKDAMYDVGLIDRWHAHKGREDRRDVLNWLRDVNLIDDEGVKKGMQLYEDALVKRELRKKEKAAMVKGACVKCTKNRGNEGKLTIGKEYEVLAEQDSQPNIRIKDDRGKTVYLSKGFFGVVGM